MRLSRHAAVPIHDGHEFDVESGLCHYRARHYDPDTGRFLQSDPLGIAAGDMNLYAYTWNDPANWSDPSGLTSSNENSRLTSGVAGMTRYAGKQVGKGAKCVAQKIGTALTSIAKNLAAGRDISRSAFVNRPGCRTGFRAQKCRCGSGGSRSSFTAGTEVLTPNGKVAIETLREGDLVIARNEDTGVSGTFPVTALMTRVALDTYWVELARADGTTTRLGVTSEHPMFVAGKGWLPVGEVEAGDKIRDAALGELLVLSVEADDNPQRVHNLEIADAHTYVAGELEAWGHDNNAPLPPQPFKGYCQLRMLYEQLP